MSSDQIVDGLFKLLGLVFRSRAIAPLGILPAFLLAAAMIWILVGRRARPWMRACKHRIGFLRTALGRDHDIIAERAAFADAFPRICSVMSDASDNHPLARSWAEYHETIIDETQTPIRNTARPIGFFLRTIPSFQLLAFFSNIFVGLGLVLTFLGIVVALDSTAKGMQGTNVAATQGALVTLLTVASAKFFASIGALTASLVLRLAEYRGNRRTRRLTNELCDLLERGLLYVSPQLLAAQQLDELQRQSAQLERFNADLAITIGEQVGARFQTAVAPIAASIGTLNTNISNMSQSLRDGLGQGAADAVSAAASGELRALGQTLESVSRVIDSLSEKVGNSGSEAAQQIRAAGADFEHASRSITEAFEQLTGRVGSLGESLTEKGEENYRRHADLLDDALKAFSTAQNQANESIAAALHRLGEAGQSSADEIRSRVGAAISSATEQSRAELVASLSQTSAAFAEAGSAMIDAVRQSAARIGELSAALQSSERGAADTADALRNTADAARNISTQLSEAAKGFQSASSPVAAAARSIHGAVEEIQQTTSNLSTAHSEALGEVRALASGLNQTNTSASAAWRDYETRFATVDEDLERTLQLLAKTLSDAMDEFRKFAHEFDLEMSKAVNRFGESLGAIEEHSEVLSDFVDAMRNRVPLAAE